MTSALSNKGQIALPIAVRERLHLEPGQEFEVSVDDDDTIVLRRSSRRPNQGLVDHLRACPRPFEVLPRSKDPVRPAPL